MALLMDPKNFVKPILKNGLESVKVDTFQNIPLLLVAACGNS
jgi:hypothetical protein